MLLVFWFSSAAATCIPLSSPRQPLPALSLPLLASAPRPSLRRRLSSPTPPLAPVPTALPAPRRSARRRKGTSARKGGSRRRAAPALAASRSTARGEVDAACCTLAGEETPLRLYSRRIHAPAALFRSTQPQTHPPLSSACLALKHQASEASAVAGSSWGRRLGATRTTTARTPPDRKAQSTRIASSSPSRLRRPRRRRRRPLRRRRRALRRSRSSSRRAGGGRPSSALALAGRASTASARTARGGSSRARLPGATSPRRARRP